MAIEPVRVVDCPFDINSVLYYLPKIAAAVGNDPRLFPLPVVGMSQAQLKAGVSGYANTMGMDKSGSMRQRYEMTTSQEKLGAYNTPFLDAKKALAEALVSGKYADSNLGEAQATAVLRGFLAWLDRSGFTYVEGANLNERSNHLSESKRQRQAVVHECGGLEVAYNLFASVKSPVGNCRNAATALAFLFLVNKVHPRQMQLVVIKSTAANKTIVFKGEASLAGVVQVMAAPAHRQSTAVCEVSATGGHVHSRVVKVTELDQPFDNHWVVRFRGRYYDPLYRAVYGNPSQVFDEAECVAFEHGITLREGEGGETGQLIKESHTTASHLVVSFASEFVSRGAGLPKGCGYVAEKLPLAENSVTMWDRWGGGAARGVGRSLVVPLEVGRMFGFCVPDQSALIKKRLMKAIAQYESSAGGFWRSVSDQSRDFCKKSRKWCGETGTTPKNNKIYSNMRDQEKADQWRGVTTWSSDVEACKAIEQAIAVGYRDPSTVGATLCATLCDAFEVPGFWRR
jgi:hypothetical protein